MRKIKKQKKQELEKTRIKITAIISVAVILLTFFLVDFRRVHSFKKPIFSVLINSQDDGGSGEYKGVTKYRFYIINKEIDSGLRD